MNQLKSSRLKVTELRDICKGMGLATIGTKKLLLQRINENMQGIQEIHDINTEIPEHRIPLCDEWKEQRDKQDEEYQECLRFDIIKKVKSAIAKNDFEDITIDELKIMLNYENIYFLESSDRHELISLLTNDVVEEKKEDCQIYAYEEEINLSAVELREARLKYFQKNI
jgi:hypothetical protein